MRAFFTNPKYRTVLEFFCALLVQIVIVRLMVLWIKAHQPFPAADSAVILATLMVGACIVSGPQVVFVLHPGNTKEKWNAAIVYFALSILVMYILCKIPGLLGKPG